MAAFDNFLGVKVREDVGDFFSLSCVDGVLSRSKDMAYFGEVVKVFLGRKILLNFDLSFSLISEGIQFYGWRRVATGGVAYMSEVAGCCWHELMGLPTLIDQEETLA